MPARIFTFEKYTGLTPLHCISNAKRKNYMLIDFIAGTKLDLYKITPVLSAVQREQDAGKDIGYRLIYTGQKRDFDDVASYIILPSIFLEAGDDTSSAYTATTLVRYEKLLQNAKPDIALVFGNSTGAMACSLAASRVYNLRIAHIGSGMRNFNRNSEEEINRRIIDTITDFHFPIAQSSGENLRNEGVSDDYIFFVGNPLADFINTVTPTLPQPAIWNLLHLQEKNYILLELAHPRVAGNTARMKSLLLNIIRLSRNLPILLPANDVCSNTLAAVGIKAPNLHVINQPDTTALLYLAKHAKVVITDNEHLQEETTIMQVPCITLLKSEARPDTYTNGYNEVTGLQPEAITAAFHRVFDGGWKKGRIPYLWDGKAADRIMSVLHRLP